MGSVDAGDERMGLKGSTAEDDGNHDVVHDGKAVDHAVVGGLISGDVVGNDEMRNVDDDVPIESRNDDPSESESVSGCHHHCYRRRHNDATRMDGTV